jgi:hypothetical protein
VSAPEDLLFRVEHGRPSAEELAVIAAVLRSRLAEQQAPGGAALPQAGWALRPLAPAGSWAVHRRPVPAPTHYATGYAPGHPDRRIA